MDQSDREYLQDLRRRTEQVPRRESGDDFSAMPEDEIRAMVHELRTHQIELELQNEELRLAQEELVSARD